MIFGFDLVALIKAAGYLGLFGIVFAESGLFVGFFLPGDSLLFTAGFLASQGFLNIWILAPLAFIAAILGDNFGYAFGRRVGPAIFTRERSLFFHKEYLERARIFYEAHGGKAIVLARFLPRWPTFLFYNVIGAVLWAIGLTFLGFYLGNAIPNIDRYLVPIVLIIVIISSLPTLLHLVRHREIFKR